MKKKNNLKKIAMLGMAGGILLSHQQADAAPNSNWENQYIAAEEGQSSRTMSEMDLLSKLSPDGKALYEGLNAEGKLLALKLANQTCKGHNDCKGQNSCKSEENACAGLGGCKGKSKGAFTDKNMAVKVAAMNMAKKRTELMDKIK